MVEGLSGGQSVAGEGGGNVDLSGYVTMLYLRSIKWWGQALPDDSTDIVGALTGVTDITMTGAISGTTNITMSGALKIGNLYLTFDSNSNAIRVSANADGTGTGNFYATGGVSALGQASGGGGGAVALTDLVDTAINNPSNGQALVYDSTTGKWKNGTITPGSTTLAALTDTSISSPTDGQVLMYDSTTGKWKNGTVQSGGGTVTSVAMSVPTGFEIGGTPITTSGTLALTFASGYSLPTTAKQTNWDTAYTNSHSHSNKSVLDGITSTDVSEWDSAYSFASASGFGTAGSDYVPITLGSTTKNVLTDHQSLSGYATEYWVEHQGYLTGVSWSQISSKPTTIGGFGITDAKFGTAGSDYVPITLGSTTKNVLTDHQSLSGYATTTDLEGYVPRTGCTSMSGTFRPSSNGGASLGTSTYRFQYMYGQYGNFSTKLTIGGFEIEFDSTNQALKFNGSIFATGGVSALGQSSGGSGGATSLADLVDTAISSPSNGQVLKYDSTSGKWVNGTITPGSTTLAALTDTNISNPTNGQVLKYNSTSGKWENANESGGGGGGTVTSVAMSVPTGLSVSGSPITSSGTLAISFASGYSIPTTAKQSYWDNSVQYDGDTSLEGQFSPAQDGGAYLGTKYYRFSAIFGQDGNFNYLTVNGTKPSSPATNGLQIGDGLISWDSTNNALKIQKKDGTAANLYALGGISALGMSSGTNGTIAANLVPETGEVYSLGNNSVGWKALYLEDNGESVDVNVNGDGYLELTGTSQGFSLLVNGDVYANRFYLDTIRYLIVSSGTLKYYNGSALKTVMLQ